MGIGLFYSWQESPQSSEQKTTCGLCALCVFGFLVLRCWVTGQALSPSFSLLRAVLTIAPLLLAVPYQWVQAFPLSVFVQKFLSVLVSWPYKNCGTDRIRS